MQLYQPVKRLPGTESPSALSPESRHLQSLNREPAVEETFELMHDCVPQLVTATPKSRQTEYSLSRVNTGGQTAGGPLEHIGTLVIELMVVIAVLLLPLLPLLLLLLRANMCKEP